MNLEFAECLKRGKITKFSRGKALAAKELRIAEEDFQTAQASFKDQRYKWATIQAYYSMFHSARALLYAQNYREKSHACLIVAVRALYVEKKQLPLKLIEYLMKAKLLRENADYSNIWSKDGAEILLKAAGDFLHRSKGLFLKNKK
jgi:uncharacterized protein (UPF0332 family)